MRRLVFLLLVGCSTSAYDEPFGDLQVTTTSPTAEKPFTTSDGWEIKYDHFFVNVSSITVAGDEGTVAASAEGVLVDEVAPGPKVLVEYSLRRARVWENVTFDVAPVDPEAATTPDGQAMAKDGYSILVSGTAHRDDVTKTFTWGFTTSTHYDACGDEIRGLVVPENGTSDANVVIGADVFFAGGFDPIAAADADADGAVTNDELVTAALDTGLADASGHLVASFRARGTCTASIPPAE